MQTTLEVDADTLAKLILFAIDCDIWGGYDEATNTICAIPLDKLAAIENSLRDKGFFKDCTQYKFFTVDTYSE